MSDALETIEEAELLDAFIASAQTELRTITPARVVSYDAAKRTVTVEPLHFIARPDGDGNFIATAAPQLKDIPVRFYKTRAFAITFPIAAGDCGSLVCCDRNIGRWRASGNAGDPGDRGMHTLDGAYFDPGLDDDAHTAQSASDSSMVIGTDAHGEGQIVIAPGTDGMQLGAGATKGVVRAGDDLTASTAQAAWAGAVEGFINGLVPGTVAPLFAAGAGVAGGLGTAHGHSAKIKAID